MGGGESTFRKGNVMATTCSVCKRSYTEEMCPFCTVTDVKVSDLTDKLHLQHGSDSAEVPTAFLVDLVSNRKIPITTPRCKVGRDDLNDIVISGDQSISRFHFVITKDADQYMVQDHKSRHGTFLNGNQIAGPIPINDGDVLKVGVSLFWFVIENQAIQQGSDQFAPVDVEATEMKVPAGEKTTPHAATRETDLNTMTSLKEVLAQAQAKEKEAEKNKSSKDSEEKTSEKAADKQEDKADNKNKKDSNGKDSKSKEDKSEKAEKEIKEDKEDKQKESSKRDEAAKQEEGMQITASMLMAALEHEASSEPSKLDDSKDKEKEDSKEEKSGSDKVEASDSKDKDKKSKKEEDEPSQKDLQGLFSEDNGNLDKTAPDSAAENKEKDQESATSDKITDPKASEDKTEAKSEEKSEDKADEKSEDKPEANLEPKSEDKPEEKSEEKADDKSETQSEDKADTKPEDKSKDDPSEKSEDNNQDFSPGEKANEKSDSESVSKSTLDKMADAVLESSTSETSETKDKEPESSTSENNKAISPSLENSEQIASKVFEQDIVEKTKNGAWSGNTMQDTKVPDWCSKYFASELNLLVKDLDNLNEQVRNAQNKIKEVENRLAATKSLRNTLLTATGEDLVEACGKVLARLGWRVKIVEDDKQELRLESDDKVSICRIIWTSGLPERTHLGQLSIAQTRFWCEQGSEPKGILIAAQAEDKPPPKITDTDYNGELADYASKKNVLMLTTLQLLAMYKEIALNEGSAEALRSSIHTSNGWLKGYGLDPSDEDEKEPTKLASASA